MCQQAVARRLLRTRAGSDRVARVKRLPLLLIALVVLFAAGAAAAQWQPVAPGVDYQRFLRGTIDAHVVRIDLREASLRVIASEREHRGLTVSEFARQTQAIVAINADYFTEKLEPMGRAIGACGVWSNGVPLKRKQGLVAFGRGRASIQKRTMKPRRWMDGAVSGWPMLVEECAPIADLPGSDFFTRAPHPRTAAGLSNDGRTLYLVVADGRREGVPGLTLPELAAFLAELGACRAMNLDGGGSSALWLGDRIVNRPSDGMERKVGNHLAVVAAENFRGCTRERKSKE